MAKELLNLKQQRAASPKLEGFRRASEEQKHSRGTSHSAREIKADGKLIEKQAGPDFDSLKATPSRRKETAVAEARARNNQYRDSNSNAGRGLPAEVTIS
jgi:hypothetical protein